ncbi:hypothetical protein AALB_3511 [Agarivorans albus MKT 106]|uniref:Uncharacterized protein n=1 Tax=Agarivorans albus MKT 106 TaxID=1331007 RepID=R9PU25_AGAAL|nr:hypothetical protein AALB_3511 [Agarivorans albus MKT 106]
MFGADYNQALALTPCSLGAFFGAFIITVLVITSTNIC